MPCICNLVACYNFLVPLSLRNWLKKTNKKRKEKRSPFQANDLVLRLFIHLSCRILRLDACAIPTSGLLEKFPMSFSPLLLNLVRFSNANSINNFLVSKDDMSRLKDSDFGNLIWTIVVSNIKQFHCAQTLSFIIGHEYFIGCVQHYLLLLIQISTNH